MTTTEFQKFQDGCNYSICPQSRCTLSIIDTDNFKGYKCNFGKYFQLGSFDNIELPSSVEYHEFMACPRGGCSK